MSGNTIREVGRAAGMSYSQVGRMERAALPTASVVQLAKVGAVVGLDVRLRTYPGPEPLRDAGQIALLKRLRILIAPGLTMRTEVPLPIEGDLRAWDAVIGGFDPAAEPFTRKPRRGYTTRKDNSAVLPSRCATRASMRSCW